MLIGEPPRSQADINFPLLGIPVRVHPMFWLGALFLGFRLPDLPMLLIWVLAVFLSIVVHEFGHAAVARHFGWEPWIVLYQFGGLALSRPTEHDAKKQIMVSLAGPLAGFAFAALIVGAMFAAGYPVLFALGGTYGFSFAVFVPDNENLNWLIEFLLTINIFWGLINLLPVYPLDGGQIAREVLVEWQGSKGLLTSMKLSIGTAVLVAVLAVVRQGADNGLYMALMFGYFAYVNYRMLQEYSASGGFGYGRDPW